MFFHIFENLISQYCQTSNAIKISFEDSKLEGQAAPAAPSPLPPPVVTARGRLLIFFVLSIDLTVLTDLDCVLILDDCRPDEIILFCVCRNMFSTNCYVLFFNEFNISKTTSNKMLTSTYMRDLPYNDTCNRLRLAIANLNHFLSQSEHSKTPVSAHCCTILRVTTSHATFLPK